MDMIKALVSLGYDEDELQSLSASDLMSLYNQKVKGMPVQNNDQTPSLEQMKQKRKPLTQQEKNAAMADLSFASPDVKENLAKNTESAKALIDSNAADMQKGTGFAYTKEALKNTDPDEYGEKPYGDASKVTESNGGEGNTTTLTAGNYTPQQFDASHSSETGYRPMGILDAWRAGCFGDKDSDEAKSSRNYLLADQLGTFMRNLGKSAGNVGAQYTGGAIDTSRDTDNWSAIQNKMADPTWQAKQEALERDNITRAYNNNMLKLRGNMANEVQKFIANAPNDTIRIKYMDIANKMLSGQTVSNEDLAFTGGAELYKLIKDALGF